MTGIAGGGHYGESGSGSTYLCLPHDPDVAPSNLQSINFRMEMSKLMMTCRVLLVSTPKPSLL